MIDPSMTPGGETISKVLGRKRGGDVVETNKLRGEDSIFERGRTEESIVQMTMGQWVCQWVGRHESIVCPL